MTAKHFNRCRTLRRWGRFDNRAASRQGMISLEVVMSIAVMMPVAGALLLLGAKICLMLYQAIGALVSWPFL